MTCAECRYYIRLWWQDRVTRRCANQESKYNGQPRHYDDGCQDGERYLGRANNDR